MLVFVVFTTTDDHASAALTCHDTLRTPNYLCRTRHVVHGGESVVQRFEPDPGLGAALAAWRLAHGGERPPVDGGQKGSPVYRLDGRRVLPDTVT